MLHKSFNKRIYGYGPYIREINIWEKYIDTLIIVAPKVSTSPSAIDLAYNSDKIKFIEVPQINLVGIKNSIQAVINIPVILLQIFSAMNQADHIHLRCPGNMGLLGSLMQIFFPKKKKTAKYAGNWDPNMKKIKSYNLQRTILSNTFLSRNIKVLVYGEWPNQSANILPFFTASYHENEKSQIFPRQFAGLIKCLYCGFLLKEKRALQSIQVVEQLHKMGYDIELTLLGDGPDYLTLHKYIQQNQLEDFIYLKGNVDANEVKEYMKNAHFLTFYGHDSEGWPKVVAESMFWGCVPLVRSVSCTRFMLGEGERGTIVQDSVSSMVDGVLFYLNNPYKYHTTSINAMNWSREYTLERFKTEIKSLICE